MGNWPPVRHFLSNYFDLLLYTVIKQLLISMFAEFILLAFAV